jgi:hypothetical protein
MLVKPFTNVYECYKDAPRPQVGDIDVVIKEKVNSNGLLYYYLQRFGEEYSYMAKLFATLPDTPAEVVEESELQTA